MKIAVIGAGISGLTSAYYLSRSHQVTVFETEDRIGGHTATIDVEHLGRSYSVDTGFIVYNDWTYPNFIKLLRELNVPTQTTRMSFSVCCDATGLEYAGSSLNALFAQRSNLLRPHYWQMLREILRFNREAVADLESGQIPASATLRDYLTDRNYGPLFIEKYLVPMGAAIWSAGTDEMLEFPLLFFIQFFKNHGLLSVKNRPQWHTIVGGSRSYLKPLTEPFSQRIETSATIRHINRCEDFVTIDYHSPSSGRQSVRFDALVIATHSDQALSLLQDASCEEQEILSAIPYQGNDVVLHTDENLLPERPLAWSSWNYRLTNAAANEPVAKLTYNMNILQDIDAPCTFCVSLNQTDDIDPAKIIGRYNYSHPVFSLKGIDAQQRWEALAGKRRTWYCGAYWGSGFHEDGVNSALRVVASIEDNEMDGRYQGAHSTAGVNLA
jgi:predicted NAD/FAD-binding protein